MPSLLQQMTLSPGEQSVFMLMLLDDDRCASASIVLDTVRKGKNCFHFGDVFLCVSVSVCWSVRSAPVVIARAYGCTSAKVH